MNATAQLVSLDNIEMYRDTDVVNNLNGPGIDAAFLNKADVNNDGGQDLIVHSLITGASSIYIQTEDGLKYNRDYQESFPHDRDWTWYGDINCDDISDRLSYLDGFTLSVETGFYENDVLKFSSAYYIVLSGSIPLFDPLDIPVFMDEDEDGDIDILSVPLSGLSVHLYENTSMNCSFEDFSLVDECWGDFSLSFMNDSIFIGSNCIERLAGDSEANMHLVPTFQIWDYDADGDDDLFIGNAAGRKLEALVNDGNNVMEAHLLELDVLDVQVDLGERPLPFILDFNGDGIDDLMVTKSLFSENEENFNWLYLGEANGNFSLADSNYLNHNSADLGSQIYPIFSDVNGDNLLDIVYSHLGRDGDNYAQIKWLENIGSSYAPMYDIKSEVLIDINDLELSELRLSTGDINGDGLEDLIFIGYLGESYFILDWKNNLTEGASALDLGLLGSEFCPLLVDLNEDGLDDLLVGERNGNINYLENMGANFPTFNLITESYGQINTQLDGLPWGQNYLSKHTLADGTEELLVLNSESVLRFYGLNGTDPDSNISPSDSIDLSAYSPALCGISVADINEDGWMEYIIGHPEGGIEFLADANAPVSVNEILAVNNLSTYPNPVDALLIIDSENTEIFSWTLRNINGLTVMNGADRDSYEVNMEDLGPGVYFLIVDGAVVKKIVISR